MMMMMMMMMILNLYIVSKENMNITKYVTIATKLLDSSHKNCLRGQEMLYVLHNENKS
jgi:hypothetical protein